jgi:hypothetical protein
LFSAVPGLLSATLLTVSAQPSTAQDWEKIGEDALAAGTEIFLARDLLEDFGDGSYKVTTLTVHPVTQRGIDVYNSDGEMEYDTRYPYRSYVTLSLYDCPRRISGDARVFYFSGTRPREDELVYDHIEPDLILMPELDPGLLRDPVFDAICD